MPGPVHNQARHYMSWHREEWLKELDDLRAKVDPNDWISVINYLMHIQNVAGRRTREIRESLHFPEWI